ncbi:hypothetical protein Save01_08224 [Streptomyces avermitilis]
MHAQGSSGRSGPGCRAGPLCQVGARSVAAGTGAPDSFRISRSTAPRAHLRGRESDRGERDAGALRQFVGADCRDGEVARNAQAELFEASISGFRTGSLCTTTPVSAGRSRSGCSATRRAAAGAASRGCTEDDRSCRSAAAVNPCTTLGDPRLAHVYLRRRADEGHDLVPEPCQLLHAHLARRPEVEVDAGRSGGPGREPDHHGRPVQRPQQGQVRIVQLHIHHDQGVDETVSATLRSPSVPSSWVSRSASGRGACCWPQRPGARVQPVAQLADGHLAPLRWASGPTVGSPRCVPTN